MLFFSSRVVTKIAARIAGTAQEVAFLTACDACYGSLGLSEPVRRPLSGNDVGSRILRRGKSLPMACWSDSLTLYRGYEDATGEPHWVECLQLFTNDVVSSLSGVYHPSL